MQMKRCTVIGIILNQKSIVHGNNKKKLNVKDKISVNFPLPPPLCPCNHHSHCQIVRLILLFLLLLSPQNLN